MYVGWRGESGSRCGCGGWSSSCGCLPAACSRRTLNSCQLPAHPAISPFASPARRFSWNKSQLEKARNEDGTQLNPLANTLRGVISGIPTALLEVASITKLDNTQYSK